MARSSRQSGGVLGGHVYLKRADRGPGHGAGAGQAVGPSRLGVDSLTAREMEVFRLIGSGLTTAQVAAQLHLSIHTIETYRLRIKSKLSLEPASANLLMLLLAGLSSKSESLKPVCRRRINPRAESSSDRRRIAFGLKDTSESIDVSVRG